jgi:hypothetical protein
MGLRYFHLFVIRKSTRVARGDYAAILVSFGLVANANHSKRIVTGDDRAPETMSKSASGRLLPAKLSKVKPASIVEEGKLTSE